MPTAPAPNEERQRARMEFLAAVDTAEQALMRLRRQLGRVSAKPPPASLELAQAAQHVINGNGDEFARLRFLAAMMREIDAHGRVLGEALSAPGGVVAIDAIAGAAHRMRTGLDVVRNCGEAIAEIAADGGDAAEIAELANEIGNSTAWLLQYSSELCDLAQLNADEGSAPEVRNTAEILAAVVANLAPLARRTGIGLRVTANDDTIEMWCDAPRLQRALHYVTLMAMSMNRVRRVELSALPTDGGRAVTFTIDDDGVSAGGAGFALARELLRRIDGKLKYATDIRGGSTATVVVPTRAHQKRPAAQCEHDR